MRWRPATLVAQALGWLDPGTNAVAPAIQPSTNFARGPDYQPAGGRTYARDENPTYGQLEALLAALDGGAAARVFGSGMAAATTAFMALAPGDHVVAPEVMYHGLRSWLERVGRPWGLAVDFVPPGDIAALRTALRPGATKLVWVETPCNPTWQVTDIAAAAAAAHAAGARLAVDGTVATPILTRPIELGADLVMHSATKYLNGHGDLLAGVLVTARDDDWWQRILELRHRNGAVLGSFESWLLLRGLRTLQVRVRQASVSALAVAGHCAGHAKVAAVAYPGLPTDPGHEVAARQMAGGFGGMLSIRVRGGRAAALRVVTATRLFVPATSLGGVESLIEHRATVEGPDSPVPDDLLRLSIGLEDTDDLIADLDAALAVA